MIRSQLFIGMALIAGVAVGYFVREGGGQEAPAESAASVPAKSAGRISDGGDAATIRSLRRRVAELESRLADAAAAAASAATNSVAAAPQQHGGRGGFRERLERMKESDPARYAQMTNSMARWRRERAERTRSTMEFLSSIDTSRMSAAARKTHAELQGAIARREELEDALRQEGLSDEQRQGLFREMHKTNRELMRLNGEERANLISETAKSLGFEGDDAKEIVDTIQEVIDATDGGFGIRRRGHHPPPPPQNRGG